MRRGGCDRVITYSARGRGAPPSRVRVRAGELGPFNGHEGTGEVSGATSSVFSFFGRGKGTSVGLAIGWRLTLSGSVMAGPKNEGLGPVSAPVTWARDRGIGIEIRIPGP